jgi:YfiH family protein
MSQTETPLVIQVKQWQQYEWLRHGFSLRAGGVSTIYGGSSLNLGWTKEDTPAAVAENRRRLVAALSGNEVSNPTLVGIRQTHSTITHSITPQHSALEGKLATTDGKPILEGDGLITNIPEVLIAVGTADCVPVFVVDIRQRVVAAFHAGWRGTAERIVQQGIGKMQADYSSRTEDLLAAVGPSIGPCCYAVGDEVRARFQSNFGYAAELFQQRARQETPSGHGERESFAQSDETYLNLWEANQRQLLDSGLEPDQIAVLGECTACSLDIHGAMRFFSHRAEHGVAGRMLNAIGVTGGGPSHASL